MVGVEGIRYFQKYAVIFEWYLDALMEKATIASEK